MIIEYAILHGKVNLVEHDFDVVAGVPVAVVIKAAGLFEDAGELHAARAHVVNVSLGVLVAVFKGALLLGLAPKDLVVAVGVEGRVNVNQVHAGVGQLGELFQIVAAINDAGVEEGGGFQLGGGASYTSPYLFGFSEALGFAPPIAPEAFFAMRRE